MALIEAKMKTSGESALEVERNYENEANNNLGFLKIKSNF